VDEERIRRHGQAGNFLVPGAGGLAGQTLGSYQLKHCIGAGGMGEVYSAWDSKLKREVAVKVLPQEFSGDSDRVLRFQREVLRAIGTCGYCPWRAASRGCS
jgi:serine/threonine protein kinase